MRCGGCRTYIPEGLPEPITCPSCGRVQGSEPSRPATSEQSPPAPLAVPPVSESARTELAAPVPLPPAPSWSTPPSATESEQPSPLSYKGPHEPELGRVKAEPGYEPKPGPGMAFGGRGASDAQDEGPATARGVFAPYFTIQTTLVFGPASSSTMLREPTRGSLSFGPDGFSIVCDGGKQWERIHYRDLASVRVEGDSVCLVVRDVESRMTLFHSWLPAWMTGTRRRRAATVAELLTRVRSGLTPYEISLFRKRLS